MILVRICLNQGWIDDVAWPMVHIRHTPNIMQPEQLLYSLTPAISTFELPSLISEYGSHFVVNPDKRRFVDLNVCLPTDTASAQ